MKLTVEVEILLKALVEVQGIVEKKNINPILSNVLLTAKTNSLTLSATDMNLYVTKVITTDVYEEGSTTVPLYQLFEIVRKLKYKDKITLTLKDKHLNLECNGFKGNLPFISPDNFPESYKGTFDNTFMIDKDSLKFLINKTKFAICLDETRYNLNGIYLHQEKTEEGIHLLKAISTDGHKLSFASISLPSSVENFKGIIIPKKTVDELYKILDKFEASDIEISISENLIVFKFPNLTLSSNLIDGCFPEYNKVIPTVVKNSIAIDTKELIDAIDLISTFSDDKIKAVKLHINGNNLTVKAAKGDGSFSGEQIISLNSSYKEFLISFNSKYLIEILHLVDKEVVYLNLNTNTSPVLINNAEDKNYLFVLMPMRI